tara:strand:- start:104 stop:337 length:234 start_codon:yes stop_codon:yes gene_type:complete
MAVNLRDTLIEALKSNAKGQLKKHQANVEIYFNNPVGIGDHADVLQSMHDEIDAMVYWEDQIKALDKYFINTPFVVT